MVFHFKLSNDKCLHNYILLGRCVLRIHSVCLEYDVSYYGLYTVDNSVEAVGNGFTTKKRLSLYLADKN